MRGPRIHGQLCVFPPHRGGSSLCAYMLSPSHVMGQVQGVVLVLLTVLSASRLTPRSCTDRLVLCSSLAQCLVVRSSVFLPASSSARTSHHHLASVSLPPCLPRLPCQPPPLTLLPFSPLCTGSVPAIQPPWSPSPPPLSSTPPAFPSAPLPASTPCHATCALAPSALPSGAGWEVGLSSRVGWRIKR